MRIIVADDNRPFEDLQSEHVDHYIMPHKSGWFGGRNLGVSQVTTPYLLWLDDDYVFHEETKLEVMVDILDNSNLDVVSGIRGKVPLYFTKMAMIPGEDDDDGVCILHETHKNYGQVPGFPDCFFATRVMNFFMGRTDGIRSVGFYPAYSRKADEDAQNNDDVIFLFERQSAVGEDHTDEVARTYAQNDDDVIFLFERQSAVGEDHTDEVARTLSDQHADDDVIFLFERRPAVEKPRPRPPPCARMRTGKH
ncbi:beta-1,4 N-acetylgalactosaminyltransferase 2-like [Branchiostoma floridae x Branchiostoma belcheri]